MKLAALILGVLGGLFGLYVGFFDYGLGGLLVAAGFSAAAALQLASAVIPIGSLVGGGIATEKPATGAVLMLASAMGMSLIFGLNFLTVIPMALSAVGGFLAILGVDPEHHEELVLFDEISTWVGKTAGWCIVILTFTTSYEVFMRYLFLAPTEWAFDASYILYGSLFMLAGAYTLSRNGHVRGDFIYRSWSQRTQARWDLVLYFLFFFPGMLAFIYAGYGYAKLSWLMHEHSSASPFGPPVYHFKSLIPIVGVLMVMQGIVEVIRCVLCIRTGEWPKRLHDVEELDKIMLEKAEHGEYEVVKELEELGVRRGDI